jgi:L-asparaginase / beta-aspartyl-peptidase
MPIAIAIQGGAGTIVKHEMSAEKEARYKAALQEALYAGYHVLSQHGTALDAVETTVKILEDCPLFNAGRGSVFTAEGTHEMDASIMEGHDLSAGAVSLVQGIKNPIALARLVMEKSGHVFLAGKGAIEFARKMHCEFKEDAYFFDQFRYNQWQSIKDTDSFQLDHSTDKNNQDNPNPRIGTVGAVGCDQSGNLAAATSTGGMTNKRWGRIGDSPIIGAGVYANNLTCAVSCTGSGEYFLRGVVAYDVSCMMEYKNYTLAQACEEVIQHRLTKIGGDGGLVAVNSKGEISMPFNTEGMYRASKTPKVETIAIYNP